MRIRENWIYDLGGSPLEIGRVAGTRSGGPAPGLGDPNEILPQSPSRWYLTGFLVPIDAASSQKVDEEATEEVDSAESGGVDDDEPPERGSARNRIFASSMGMSVLVPAGAKTLEVTVTWGDYEPRSGPESWAPRPA